MADRCLTTRVANGKGTIAQIGDGTYDGCNGDPKGPDLLGNHSCAANYPVGTENIQIVADPDDANGWEVQDWKMIDSDTDVIVNGYFEGPTAGENAVSITMPDFDVDVMVTFINSPVDLILIPMTVGGCIQLISPTGSGYDNNCYKNQTNQLLPAISTIVGATPDSGYQISSWTIDGVSQGATASQISVSLITAATYVTVKVWFEIEGPCDTNDLNITIVGNGSVNPPSGKYCVDDILTLTPVPAYGYFFKRWEYDISSSITENGITLIVPMNSDKNVTAIFESLPSFEPLDGHLFYCPSTTNKNNVVSFDFTNNNTNPSIEDIFHFRVNFYSDSTKQRLLYSASSLIDNKRWFYNDVAFESFSSEGIIIEENETINIIYDPEILPSQITENQREKFIGNSAYEYPLVCGVKYYVEIESYDIFTGVFSFVQIMSLILNCEDVSSYYWDYNKDDNNWLCSGQGKTDLQVSSSSQSQSIFPNVSSNIHGIFQIVWQTRRDNIYQVYGAVWDSELDILYSSGQGRYDELKLVAGYSPIVLTDQANNFYIAGHTTEGKTPGNIINYIYVNACQFPISISHTPEETSTGLFAKLCTPGMTTYLTSVYDQIKARICQDDISGSLVINKDKVVPIINKSLIKLDIDGIDGAYAVRLRNMNDQDWGGWINIDNNLYYAVDDVVTSDDDSHDAYRIDNSRFIVPWNVDMDNGLKRICCQVLTLYGITNVFCLDLFFNFDVPRHVFKFYSKLEGVGTSAIFKNEFPIYNGRYVLSLKDEQGNIQYADSIVYFKIIFSESIYKNGDESYEDEELTFNMVQQGINGKWREPLYRINDKTFYGHFDLSQEDGVFNKDGNSFIKIVFPETIADSTCLSNDSDLYNLMITNDKAVKYKDLIPEEVYDKIRTDNVGKVFDLNQFKQYYDQDDDNFKFGNPGYFRK